MHPEVRQIGPGNCPKCGMALEPVVPPWSTASTDAHSPQWYTNSQVNMNELTAR